MTKTKFKNGEIYLGDSMEIIKTFLNNSIDMILIDPPYNKINGMKLQGQKESVNWDIKIDWNELFKEFNRVIKKGGSIIVFGQQPTYSEMILSNLKYFKYEYIWEKNNCAQGFHFDKMPLIFTENIAVFVVNEQKENKRTFNKNFKKEWEIDWTNFKTRKYAKDILNFINLPRAEIHRKIGNRKLEFFFYYKGSQFGICSENLYNELINKFLINKMDNFLSYEKLKMIWKKEKELNKGIKLNIDNISGISNILKFSKDSSSIHPTQKPLKLIEELIKRHSKENEIILDCFSGSGTTAIACEKTNRKWICIEINEQFYKKSIERILKS